MAEGVYDAAKEVARTHIVKGVGSDSKDFEFFFPCASNETPLRHFQ